MVGGIAGGYEFVLVAHKNIFLYFTDFHGYLNYLQEHFLEICECGRWSRADREHGCLIRRSVPICKVNTDVCPLFSSASGLHSTLRSV